MGGVPAWIMSQYSPSPGVARQDDIDTHVADLGADSQRFVLGWQDIKHMLSADD